MGAYLGSPIKEKVQEDGGNNKIAYMATSMQGWRVHQEDAHNCILNFGNKCSLFAVYDGHGGSEVAVYISENFPKFLLESGLFESKDLTAALQKFFVEFDSTLCNEKVIQAMNLVKEKENPPKTHANEEEEREALFEEAVALSKEASVSLGTIIQQYAEISRQMQDGDGRSEKRALGEPSAIVRYVKRRRIHRENATVVEALDDEIVNSVTVGSETVTSTTETTTTTAKVNGSSKVDSKKSDKSSSEATNGSEANAEAEMKKPAVESNSEHSGRNVISSASDEKNIKKNGEKSKSHEQQSDEPHSTKSDGEAADTASTDDEDDDEDYDVEEDEEEEVDDEEQVIDESAEDQEEAEDEEDELLGKNKPGYDSGATACVALLFEDRVVVANVGDSRAVLCRDGKAIDLSTDHKPEDTIEKERIENAGGAVSDDGRVNGGLNLSRALGDHYYKQKADLPLEKQMITAWPDVLTSEITDKDTLLVIACDGIWNSLTSQEVVDFINKRIGTRSLKEIGAEICDHCCAADTSGDGTGCDNMTIIIVDLKAGKRGAESTKMANATGDNSAATD